MVNRGTQQRAGIVATAFAAAVVGCVGVPAENGHGPDAGDTDTGDPIPLTAVDLLVVVDNTDGMMGSQWILESKLFALVGSLMQPLPTSAYAAIDDMHIAAITTNMGFSANGEDMDEYWPGDIVPVCQGFGDDGRFQEIGASSIELSNDTIPCDESGAQCPLDWTCAIGGDAGVDGGPDAEGVGVCHTDGSTTVNCPIPSDDGTWFETTPDAPNADLAVQAACLALRGFDGCGWEQPFASTVRALTREDQADFVRDNAVLAVIAVGDEDDCSMQDGQGMFAEEEVADQSMTKVGLACGNHPENLFPASHFYDVLTGLKPDPSDVVYGAIVGVPWAGEDPEGATACEGFGNQLGDCLAQDAMQLVPEQTDGNGWWFRAACENSGTYKVAWPGVRYVELASDFGANGYVYSICNEDWSPAFDALGAMIAGKLAS
jgi:hypothetical protein